MNVQRLVRQFAGGGARGARRPTSRRPVSGARRGGGVAGGLMGAVKGFMRGSRRY